MLVNGKWSENWHPYQGKPTGNEFVRQQAGFRHKITKEQSPTIDGEHHFTLEVGRYRLYVALICPQPVGLYYGAK